MIDQGLRLEKIQILHDDAVMVSLDARIQPGDVLTVMGPSGSGKSTLLNAIIGTMAPEFRLKGRIVLDGEDITHMPTQKRQIGILFQDALLFPHISVAGNLAFGLKSTVRGRAARREKVARALKEIGLEGFADLDPTTLSGGQRARVALMRMLLAEPRALLLDEPFSGLDASLRDQIRRMVFARARAHKLPVLLVTHDTADAHAAGGEVVSLSARKTPPPPRP